MAAFMRQIGVAWMLATGDWTTQRRVRIGYGTPR